MSLKDTEFIPGVSLPRHTQQLLALFTLLNTIKRRNDAKNEVQNDKNTKSNTAAMSDDFIINSIKYENTDFDDDLNTEILKFRGLIFVEQVALTFPLSHLINKYFQDIYDQENFTNLKCEGCHKDRLPVFPLLPVSLPVSGGDSMADSLR